VTLDDGDDRISVFLKHLGSEESEHPDKDCPDREVRMYADLLDDRSLPVPRYYGAFWNPESKHHELYLEYIDGWNLKYQEIDHWYTAASSLARLHLHFAAQADRLRKREYLLKLDRAYFRQWAERASSALAAHYPLLASRLDPVFRRYHEVAALLSAQPPTLVHNDLAPKNVLADHSADPVRICFIDWEMAGVGCGLLDLVHLRYGLDPVSARALSAAYLDEVAGAGLVPSGEDESSLLLSACELHQALYRLAHCPWWGFSEEKAVRFVDEAEGHFRAFEKGA